MPNITDRIFENNYNKISIDDFFIILMQNGILYIGETIDRPIHRLYQGNKGIIISWYYKNKVYSVELNEYIDQYNEYYRNIKKNINLNSFDIPTQNNTYVCTVTKNGLKISESTQIQPQKISNPYCIIEKEKRINDEKDFLDMFDNNEDICKGIMSEIIDNSLSKINDNIELERSIEHRLRKEIEEEFKIKRENSTINDIKQNNNDINDHKDNIIKNIKEQVINLANLYQNDKLKKILINMVNELQPEYILPDKTIEINDKSNNDKLHNDKSNNDNEKPIVTIEKPIINPKIVLHPIRKNYDVIDPSTKEQNDEYRIIMIYRKTDDIIMNPHNDKFINNNIIQIPIESARIWMAGGGSSGNNQFGGKAAKTQYFNVINNIITIKSIGKGGKNNNMGDDTIITLKNNKSLLSKGGSGLTSNIQGEKNINPFGYNGGNGGDINKPGDDGFVIIKYK